MTPDAFELLRPPSRHPLRLWLLSGLFVALAGYGGWHAWQLERDTEAARASLIHLQSKRRVPTPPKPSKAETEMASRWAALAGERAFNWYPVFRALEQTANADIELLEFLPEKVGRRITLRGEALSSAALLAYVDALANEGSMAEVYLAHQKVIQRNGINVVGFEIRMLIATGSEINVVKMQ